jgi:hypothetical protein
MYYSLYIFNRVETNCSLSNFLHIQMMIEQLRLRLHCNGYIFCFVRETLPSKCKQLPPPPFYGANIADLIWKSEQTIPVSEVRIASCCLLDAILNHELNRKLLRFGCYIAMRALQKPIRYNTSTRTTWSWKSGAPHQRFDAEIDWITWFYM